MNTSQLIDLLNRAYHAGFEASGEGWNGEYPTDVTERAAWKTARKVAVEDLAIEASARDLVE